VSHNLRGKGEIKEFRPADTDTEFYLHTSANIEDILLAIKLKWPKISLGDVEISAEHIHTRCLTYDLYDSGDYTDFLKISRTL